MKRFATHELKSFLFSVAFLTLGPLFIAPLPAADFPAPAPEKVDGVVGRWRGDGKNIVVINADGTAKRSAPGQPTYHGKWVAHGSEYDIDWNGGLFIDRVILRGNGNELWRKNKKGQWHHMATRL